MSTVNELEFTIRPTDEFIELNKLLKLLKIAQTGGHAKIMIQDGLVSVNGKVESRVRCKLRDQDVVESEGNKIKVLANKENQE